jgi:DNA invertase Pin-like site-specific DNA recombinase
VAVAIPAAILVAATGLSLPEWLAAGLLGLAPLITAAWLVTFLRREPEPAPEPYVWPVEKPEPPAAGHAIGYVVLEPGDGQLAQRSDELRLWCAAKGLTLSTVVHDSVAEGDQRSRPSLQWALAQIDAGAADTLVVTRLVDLSPNVTSLSPLLRWFMAGGRELVAIDLRLDTSTPEGQLAAAAVPRVGSCARDRNTARTRRGLEAARSRGGGHGRQAVADNPELQARITRMREDGMTLQAIADVLNAEGVPTLRGGTMWRPSSVQRAAGYRRPPAASAGIELPRRSA